MWRGAAFSLFFTAFLGACQPYPYPYPYYAYYPNHSHDFELEKPQKKDDGVRKEPLVYSQPEPVAKPTPIVLGDLTVNIAFDGSESLTVWRDTLDFAAENNVKFTFFIVGVHLLQDDLAELYDPPGRSPGRSDVGFGGTKAEVQERLSLIRRAYREGHEIGGHANGHWDGSAFTYEEWMSELDQFRTFVSQAYELNEITNPNKKEWQELTASIRGFRAPLLAYNDAMYDALSDSGYLYDTSKVKTLRATENYAHRGLTIYPLTSLMTDRGRTITMDYNFFVLDEGRLEGGGQNMLNAYRKHVAKAVSMGGAPIQIGHHFSRWNKGQYWWALKEFIKEFCNEDEVQCITFQERFAIEQGTLLASLN